MTASTFGPLTAGRALTEADLLQVFPGATTRLLQLGDALPPTWKIVRDDLQASFSADKIVIARGPVHVHGMRLGEDGSKLADPPFADALCQMFEPTLVMCYLDSLTLMLRDCPEVLPVDDEGGIPNNQLGSCTFSELFWFSVRPPDE